MHDERQQPDQQRGEPEPEQEDTRRRQFQRHQDETEDQPVPGAKGNAKRGKHLGHDTTSPDSSYCGTAGGVGVADPADGTEVVRLAAACADIALSPNVAFAISPMPASEPSMLTASIGSMTIFWFGAAASWPNALMYLSAMK